MKTKAKSLAQEAKQDRFEEIREAWQASEYAKVIESFRDNRDFPFVGHMIIAIRHLEAEILKELKTDVDDYDTDDERISDLVLERLIEWEEHLRVMAQMLLAASDRARKIFDEIEGEELAP